MATVQLRLKMEDVDLIVDVLGAVACDGVTGYDQTEIEPVEARLRYLAARARQREARKPQPSQVTAIIDPATGRDSGQTVIQARPRPERRKRSNGR